MPFPLHRALIHLQYKLKPFVTIPFELTVAEGQSLVQPELLPSAINLGPVHLSGPDEISFLPMPYQIAQKLHACTEYFGDERSNQRARDLLDLILIEDHILAASQLATIRSACIEIFRIRDKQNWPVKIEVFPDWPLIWQRLQSEENITMTLEEAVDRVNMFVSRINSATD